MSVIPFTYHHNIDVIKERMIRKHGPKVWAITNGRCYYCGDVAVVVDHVVPRSAGGSDSEKNKVPSCWSCNSRKGGMMPGDYKIKTLGSQEEFWWAELNPPARGQSNG